jgi:hypothetical protein
MSLTTYLQNFNSLESQLGWTSENYENIVTLTLEYYGVDTEDEATDLLKLYRIGIWQLWESIAIFVSFDSDISSDGNSMKRSQLFENARRQADTAKTNCIQYLSDYKHKYVKYTKTRDEFERCYHAPYHC